MHMFTSRRSASCSCPTIDEKIDAAHSPLGQGQCRGLSVLSSIQRHCICCQSRISCSGIQTEAVDEIDR